MEDSGSVFIWERECGGRQDEGGAEGGPGWDALEGTGLTSIEF